MTLRETQHLFRFAKQNREFWDAQIYPGTDAPPIIVDIMHDNQWYIRWNLLTAKYLQKIYGGRIIAVQHHWPTPLIDYNPELNAVLAASYGIEAIIDLDERKEALRVNPAGDELALIEIFEAQLENLSQLSGHDLRQALLTFEANGNPDFGWLTYDTFIRSHRCATVEHYSEELGEAYRDAFYWSLTIRRLAQVTRFGRCVLGHIEYMPYAFLAHSAIDAGGEAYFMWPLVAGTLRCFRDRESLRQNRDKDFVNFFHQKIEPNIDPESQSVQQFWRGFRNKFAATRAYKRDNMSDSARMDRTEFLSSHKLDPSKRSVCLMSHALSDAVHANGPMIFDDFGQWIIRTLEMCEGRDDINVLLKVHPRDRTYSRDFMIPKLIRRFDYAPNIAILPRTVENADIVSNCDAVVTVHGTPGYELPLQGARSITAGQSRYSGLGICLEPKTEEEYLDSLLGKYDDTIDLEEARERALKFAYAEFNLLRSPTLFVRTDKVRVPPESPFWLEEAQTIGTLSVEDDPYYHAVNALVRSGATHFVRTITGSGPVSETPPASPPVEQLVPNVQRQQDDTSEAAPRTAHAY